ncbi:FAD:protein FMN transferase [Tumebacillus flagellatus]|uniref:FAD:protein FMN transferase n=1 Tax=Tumebacillus flagellatus TaxID=1157490 RepID=A0A074LVR3_9BACL|nr:FAD:protein FMN transferase [Tumebacillus flagellatus]KEO84630.1 hypothetical protein EL26_03695 [Tumebacillus flagellatus]
MEKTNFRAMNTNIEVCFQPAQPMEAADMQTLMTDVQLLFEQVEEIASRFRPDSELSKLNAAVAERSGGPRSRLESVSGPRFRLESATAELGGDGEDTLTWMPISSMLCEMLKAAEDAFYETEGIFNPGLLRHLQTAGYDDSFEKLPAKRDSRGEADAELPLPTVLPFQLDLRQKAIRVQPGTQLDLGGIAKGWTVDRAARHLRQFGCGFVNAGGDLRAFGQPQEPWNIGVADPFDPERNVAELQLSTGAVATSSTVKRRWQQGSAWQHHLLDARTGRPSNTTIASATVTAPTAVQADVWAKTALLLGPKRGAEFLQRRKQKGVFVEHSRHVQVVN